MWWQGLLLCVVAAFIYGLIYCVDEMGPRSINADYDKDEHDRP